MRGRRQDVAAASATDRRGVFKAIDNAVGMSGSLADYQVRAVTAGKDRSAEVTLAVAVDGAPFRGQAVSSDVMEASAKAYVRAMNNAASRRGGLMGSHDHREDPGARRRARRACSAGEIVEAKVDLVLANDITAPLAIAEFEKAGVDQGLRPGQDRPGARPLHAQQGHQVGRAGEGHARVRPQAGHRHTTSRSGAMGIEHALLPEQGLVAPGDVVIGADSPHLHLRRAGRLLHRRRLHRHRRGHGHRRGLASRCPRRIKFVYSRHAAARGSAARTSSCTPSARSAWTARSTRPWSSPARPSTTLSMDERFTMCNMAIEAGGKNGIFAVDEKTAAYLQSRPDGSRRAYGRSSPATPTPTTREVIEIDVSGRRAHGRLPAPARATPRRVGRAAATSRIDQVGHRLLHQRPHRGPARGRRASSRAARCATDVRCIVLPGTQQIYLEAMRRGPHARSSSRPAAPFSTPTCGPCLGGHMGILAEGERCRRHHQPQLRRAAWATPSSEVYLASPAVAAASAIAGHIATPDDSRRGEHAGAHGGGR